MYVETEAPGSFDCHPSAVSEKNAVFPVDCRYIRPIMNEAIEREKKRIALRQYIRATLLWAKKPRKRPMLSLKRKKERIAPKA